MERKVLFLSLGLILVFAFAGLTFAQEQPVQKETQPQAPEVKNEQPVPATQPTEVTQPAAAEEVIKGTVKEVANDGSFIVVDTTKISTTKEFLEDSYLEVGDNVEIVAEKTDKGLKAKSYNYIFEEEPVTGTEEVSPEIEQVQPQGE